MPRNGSRVCACLSALALVLAQAGCHTWKGVTVPDVRTRKVDWDHDIRITFPEGQVVLKEPWTLDYPRITGIVTSRTDPKFLGAPAGLRDGRGLETFDLERAQLVELSQVSGAKVALVVVGSILGTIAIIAATKSSCPFVYVDEGDGPRLAGEGYPGAVFKPLQREDLLALPVKGTGDLAVRLTNWAPEVQYTDRLEVVLLDHDPALRPLPAAGGGLVLAGPPVRPLAARDLDGKDQLALVALEDGRFWQTELRTRARQEPRQALEGLVVDFPALPTRPLLELRLKNTKWMEGVFGRYFAMMGDHFDALLRTGNSADAEAIKAWRRREGVDLRVEALRDGRWVTLGWVTTPGSVASRTVAVPFPADWPAGAPERVRLTGGAGFWRVDSAFLAPLAPVAPAPVHIPMSAALAKDGTDPTAALGRVDGAYNVLPAIGDWVEARFVLPPRVPGLARAAFLASNGYYNPHPPAVPEQSLRTLARLRDEEGSLGRFSLALYRRHEAFLHTPATP